MAQTYALVMAGGKGTRFWPESTSNKPKQYLTLFGERSLLEQTLERFEGLIDVSRRYIVTVKDQEALAKENSKGLVHEKALIFEPSGRNTAPCILLSLASLRSQGAGDDDVVVVVPSDHVILQKNEFQKTVSKAIDLASSKKHIVTIGIPPLTPHTGYGYIECGENYDERSAVVSSFKEKPERSVALKYLDAGNYVWNAGMFVGSLKTLEEEFSTCSPEINAHYEDLKSAVGDDSRTAAVYNKIKEDSFDYAVMEKTSRVSVVKASFDWNDLGSWDALEAVVERIDENTDARSAGHVFLESTGNIVFAPGKHVSLIGVDDLIVVSNEKNVLIARKDRSQDVKKVVQILKEQGDPSSLT